MKKVAIGCGIFALVILAITIAVFVFGARWMKGQFAELKHYEEQVELMTSTYGKPEDFLPPADGVYDPDRIALFASLTGKIDEAGAGFVADAEALADYGEQGWWSDMKTMIQIINNGMGFLATADSLLLDAEMGRGEYVHYRVLLLEGFFGDSPDAFLDSGPGEVRNTDFYEAFEEFAGEYGTEAHRLLQSHARLAREAAEGEGAQCEPCVEWADYLGEQLDAARTRRRYIPLTDPLPASLAAAFEEQRTTLSATRPDGFGTWLLSILMVMELEDDEGGFQFNFEN